MEEVKEHPRKLHHKVWVFIKRYKWLEIGAGIVVTVLLWAPTVYANLSTRSSRYDLSKTPVQNIPKHKVALVFGAGVLPDGQPTPYLYERVATSVNLYKAGRVEKILVSGDNSTSHYNEPQAMKTLAVSLGAKEEDVVLDYAGYSTYDSCYRAKKIFSVRDATLVSQGYHLPRAVMTCKGLGINSIGVNAQHTSRDFTASFIMREWLSTDKAVVQNWIKPNPTLLGNPEPIE